MVFESNPSDHETRSTGCHVGIHVDFISIVHSRTLLVPQAYIVWSNKLGPAPLFHQRECLKRNNHMPSISCVKWPPTSLTRYYPNVTWSRPVHMESQVPTFEPQENPWLMCKVALRGADEPTSQPRGACWLVANLMSFRDSSVASPGKLCEWEVVDWWESGPATVQLMIINILQAALPMAVSTQQDSTWTQNAIA